MFDICCYNHLPRRYQLLKGSMFISGENRTIQLMTLNFIAERDQTEITLPEAIKALNTKVNEPLTADDKLRFLLQLGLADAIVQLLPGLLDSEPEIKLTQQE